MAGRQKNKEYEELGFDLLKINNKHTACCRLCKKNLKNTAADRLKGHRNPVFPLSNKINKFDNKQAVELAAFTLLIASWASPNAKLKTTLWGNGLVNDIPRAISRRNNRPATLTLRSVFISLDIALGLATQVISRDRSFCVIDLRNVCKLVMKGQEETASAQLADNAYYIINLDDSQEDPAWEYEVLNEFVSDNVEVSNETKNLGIVAQHLSNAHEGVSVDTKKSATIAYTSTNTKKKSSICKKNSSISNFIDKLSEKDEVIFNEALAIFFFGCNIPLKAVDSINFKNFIKKIRPAYADKLPGRKALSTTLLDNAYDKCLSSVKTSMSSQSVLLIDGWKNCSNNSKTVVSMLHNANGEQAFLHAWDLTGESETAEKLADIVSESIDIAKSIYSTNIYAVVSDNASAMLKMGKITKHFIWHSNCSSHTANLLAKDVLNKDLTVKATSILKEFKQADFEKSIVERGGTRIKLPCDTRWCSYRDAFKCLIQNHPHMKFVAADSKNKKIKQNIASLIFDDDFIDEVQDNINLMDPICELINTCQSTTCSVADAVNMWLDLKFPSKFESKFFNELKTRTNMALNEYALAAYYLHPHFDNNKLNKDQKDVVCQFLFQNLDGTGIEEWDSFNNRTNFFKTLYEKNLEKPLVFWNMAEMKYPTLATLAKKLLQIPASSAQIERIFSSWAHVHSSNRNRLTFERSKKLLYLFYTLRMQDVIYDENEK